MFGGTKSNTWASFSSPRSPIRELIKSPLDSVEKLNRILIWMTLLTSIPDMAAIRLQTACSTIEHEFTRIIFRQASITRDVGLQCAVHGPYSLFGFPLHERWERLDQSIEHHLVVLTAIGRERHYTTSHISLGVRNLVISER